MNPFVKIGSVEASLNLLGRKVSMYEALLSLSVLEQAIKSEEPNVSTQVLAMAVESIDLYTKQRFRK